MKEGLYLDSGYLNVDYIKHFNANLNIIIGGRGTGKTYGVLSDCMVKEKRPFIYARRTDKMLTAVMNSAVDPLKPIADDNGMKVTADIIAHTGGSIRGWFNYKDGEDGKKIKIGDPIGIAIALSTFGNVRGFNGDNYEDYIFDEFIKEPQMVSIADDEAYVYFNSIETINRNREFRGRRMVRCWALSNSEDLTNDLFIELGLIDTAECMRQSGREVYYDAKRKILLVYLLHSPISEKKAETGLYQMTKGTSFAAMAIGNEFVNDSHGRVRSMKIDQFYPIVNIGELTMYRSKVHDYYYGSLHKSGSCMVYGTDPVEQRKFRRGNGELLDQYMAGNVIFETRAAEALFQKFMGLK